MVSSKAKTVRAYLGELPVDRRRIVAGVRKLILDNLPEGFEEGMQYGMIGYYVPLSRFPKTYNGQPLTVAALAAQKGYTSLYLMGAYGDARAQRRLEEGFRKAGKKLDMGKSCLRFKSLDDLPLDVIARAIAAATPEDVIAQHERAHPRR